LAIELECFLDKRHGADYFRRWHRRKENSGGLLVHEGTHLFDLVNWWLADQPRDVFAMGERRVYGPTRAARGERCSTCPHTATCEFYVDLAAEWAGDGDAVANDPARTVRSACRHQRGRGNRGRETTWRAWRW